MQPWRKPPARPVRTAIGANAPITQAVRAGDVPTVRALLRHHVNLNEPLPDQSTLLAWAVESQSREMVRLLLDHGAKASGVWRCLCRPALHRMPVRRPNDSRRRCSMQHADVKGVNARTASLLLSVCAGNARAVLERMIAAGAAVDDTADNAGQTPLMWAAARGARRQHQASGCAGREGRTAQSAKGFTPLFFSLKSHVTRARQFALLDLGADPDYVAP